MTRSRPDSLMLCATAAALVGAAGLAQAQTPPGFTLVKGFPVVAEIPHWDGAVFVNLDEDPEDEILASTGTFLRAWNVDGTTVPGWGIDTGSSTFSTPAVGDIDGDGEDEIVYISFFFGIRSNLWALEKDGTNVPGFPFTTLGSFKSPTLADLDGDDDLEIIVTGNVSGLAELSIFEGDGTPFAPFPSFQFGELSAGQSAAVGDIDNDGDPEIVVGSFFRLFAFEADGSVMPGFPWVQPDETHAFNSYNSPTLVDIDGDDDLEILISTSIEQQDFSMGNTPPGVHLLNHDATYVPGWPQDLPTPGITGNGATSIFSPPIVADIDNDGAYDIIASDVTLCPSECNVLMAWDAGGNPKPGFPVAAVTATQNGMSIADIDGDGTMEIFKDNNRAANPPQAFNHDGTPLAGWEFTGLDGSAQITFGDYNHDGFMDMIVPAANITTAVQATSFYLYTSDTVPFSPEAAPVALYQYDLQRTGVAPAIGSGCGADFNGDGTVNILDVLAFINNWNVQGAGSDFNGDGAVNILDVLDFIAAWNAGCA